MPRDDWPPSFGSQAAELQAAFPSYSVVVTPGRHRLRFELVTKEDDTPWCLISADAREIWEELGAKDAGDM